MGKAELVAYCGIYCGDCLGYTGVIADAAEGFVEVLDRYQFERTAAGVFPEELEDYGRFREILAFRAPGWELCTRGSTLMPVQRI